MNNLAYKLVQNCEKMPNKICLIEKNQKYTYKELYNIVANFKNYLLNLGIRKGDKVLVLVPMSVNLYATLLSIWAIGATPCFMDAGFIKSGMNKNDFSDINAIVGITKYIIYSNINKNLRNLKIKVNVSKAKTMSDATLEVEEVDKNVSAIMTYTSGTTGKPKITSRTHEFLISQGKILEETLNYDNNDIELSSMPIFTLSNIYIGITTVITDGNYTDLGKSNPEKIIKQINLNKINRIMAAPGILTVIVEYCIKNNIKFENVKKILTGGGAVFVDFIDKLKKVFPNSVITTIYGSTEAEPIAEFEINNVTNDDLEKIKSGHGILAGNIVGVDDCKLIQTGISVIGELSKEDFDAICVDYGEIVVTGKNVLKGYVGEVGDKENKFSVDGIKYHRTGDLGTFDKDGRLWLRGRIKEPYFNIEAALHAKFDIGKTAVFDNDGKIILVLENQNIKENLIRKEIDFAKIDEIKYVKKIPVDKRHSTKVDYKELRKILGI
ncbi:MAG: acyl--CoA ligase [Clostridia bacterium]|nr:acyl--CoA ligase [Clostridia bacterium]